MRDLTRSEMRFVGGADIIGDELIAVGGRIAYESTLFNIAPPVEGVLRQQGEELQRMGRQQNDDGSGSGGGSTGPTGHPPVHPTLDCVKFNDCKTS